MKRPRTSDQRGYVMVVVLLILAVLLSAGLYGIKAMENDLRASHALRKNEILSRAAEAGAAHRISEISLARDDAGAALNTNISWTAWPANGTFAAGSIESDIEGLTQYQVVSQPLVSTESRPPAGVQVGRGGQTTVWEIDSFAVGAGSYAGGEHAVSTGVRLWSRGGRSYNN